MASRWFSCVSRTASCSARCGEEIMTCYYRGCCPQCWALSCMFISSLAYSIPLWEMGHQSHFTGEETEASKAKWLFQGHTISNWQRKKFKPGLTINPACIPPNQPLCLPHMNPAPQSWFMDKNWNENERMQIIRKVRAQGRTGKEKW